MNRLGRGYDVMMAYSHYSTFSKMALSTEPAEREINYGADISTLVRLIEEGKL